MTDASGAVPWRRRARTVVYRNAWIEVYHDEVVRPDGRPGVYGVVHPTFVATGVVAIDAADRAVLVGQHRYTLNVYSWEIPAGGVPFDESVLDGARRELAEETGYVAVRWRELLHFSLLNSLTDERGVVFLATELTEDVAAPDGTEDITVRLVPFDEAVEMATSGEIHDAVSQLGLLAAARALGR